MGAVTHDDWKNLRAHVQRVAPLDVRALLIDFDLLFESGLELPLVVCSAAGDTAELRVSTTTGKLELVAGGYAWGAPSYRHTDGSGRRSQTRSVYLDDETWEAVCSLGEPSEVMREAVRSYVRARRRPSARAPGTR